MLNPKAEQKDCDEYAMAAAGKSIWRAYTKSAATLKTRKTSENASTDTLTFRIHQRSTFHAAGSNEALQQLKANYRELQEENKELKHVVKSYHAKDHAEVS